jgi:hypothetical protein
MGGPFVSEAELLAMVGLFVISTKAPGIAIDNNRVKPATNESWNFTF